MSGDQYLDDLLNDMIEGESDGNAQNDSPQPDDTNYLEMLYSMVHSDESGDQQKQQHQQSSQEGDDLIEDLLNSMTNGNSSNDSQPEKPGSRSTADYSDVLDGLLNDTSSDLTSMDIESTIQDLESKKENNRPLSMMDFDSNQENDYTDLMDELLAGASDSNVTHTNNNISSGKDEDYSSLMDELLRDNDGGSFMVPSSSSSNAPSSDTRESKTADDLLDELLADSDMMDSLPKKKSSSSSSSSSSSHDGKHENKRSVAESRPESVSMDQLLAEFGESEMDSNFSSKPSDPNSMDVDKFLDDIEESDPKKEFVRTDTETMLENVFSKEDMRKSDKVDAQSLENALLGAEDSYYQNTVSDTGAEPVSENDDLLQDLLNEAEAPKKQENPEDLLDQLLGDVTNNNNNNNNISQEQPKKQESQKRERAPTTSDMLDDLLGNITKEDSNNPSFIQKSSSSSSSSSSSDDKDSKSEVAGASEEDLLDAMINQLEEKKTTRQARLSLSTATGAATLESMLSDAELGSNVKQQKDQERDAANQQRNLEIEEAEKAYSASQDNNDRQQKQQQYELKMKQNREEAIKAEELRKKKEREDYQLLLQAQQDEQQRKDDIFQQNVLRQQQQRAELEAFKEQERKEEERRKREEAERNRSIALYIELNFGSKLGVGGSGQTFRGGPWRATGLQCVLKQYTCNRFSDGWIQDFQETSRNYETLDHPNVVKFLAGCTQESYVAVSEYTEGASLASYLANSKLVESDDPLMAQTAREIARALQYLHHNDIIHRSLKPKNIFLTGAERTIKVGDYGFTEIKDYQHSVGTIRDSQYHAPEMYDSSGRGRQFDYNKPLDVYAFAIILWEMFSKETAFDGIDTLDIPVAVRQGKRPAIPDSAPVPFKNLMIECWNPSPNSRPTFEQIVSRLDAPLSELMVYDSKRSSDQTRAALSIPGSKGIDVQADLRKLDPEKEEKLKLICMRIIELFKNPLEVNQLKACKATLDLVGKCTSHLISSTGLIKQMLQILSNQQSKPSVKEGILRTMVSMMERDREFIVEFGVNNGALGAILPFIQDLGQQNLLLWSFKVLQALCTNENVQDLMRHIGAIKALVNVLQSSNVRYQAEAVRVIGNILQNSGCVSDFATSGGVVALLDLQNTTNVTILVGIIQAVKYLLKVPEIKTQIVPSGVLTKFTKFLTSTNEILQKVSTSAISEFSEDKDVRHSIDTGSLIPGLLHVLSLKDDPTTIASLKCITLFLTDLQHCQTFIKNRGVQHIAVTIKSENIEMRMKSVFLVSSLLTHIPQASSLIFATAIVPDIVNIFLSPKEDRQKAGLFILYVMTLHEPKSIEGIGLTGALPGLIKLMEHPDSTIKTKSLQTVATLTNAPKNREIAYLEPGIWNALQRLISTDEQIYQDYGLRVISNLAMINESHLSMRENKLIPTVIEKLNSNNSTVQSLAIKTMLLLARNPENKSMIKEANGISVLESLSGSAQQNISLAAQKTLQFLS